MDMCLVRPVFKMAITTRVFVTRVTRRVPLADGYFNGNISLGDEDEAGQGRAGCGISLIPWSILIDRDWGQRDSMTFMVCMPGRFRSLHSLWNMLVPGLLVPGLLFKSISRTVTVVQLVYTRYLREDLRRLEYQSQTSMPFDGRDSFIYLLTTVLPHITM